jgi:hypothetical protein
MEECCLDFVNHELQRIIKAVYVLIFSVDGPDVFPLDPPGVYYELRCSIPG